MDDLAAKLRPGLPSSRTKILIIEDDPLVATIYTNILKQEGWEWEVVADGSDAFHRLHQTTVDLVILDLMLPSMDGLAILRKIRAQKKFLMLPVLVVTSLNIASIQGQLHAAGASHVLAKTELGPGKVIETIKRLLAAVPMQPLDLLPTPKIEEPILEEIRQQPDLRVQPSDASQSPMPAQIRMASLPESGAATPNKPAAPADPPGVRITEDTGISDAPLEKKGLLSRLFRKNK